MLEQGQFIKEEMDFDKIIADLKKGLEASIILKDKANNYETLEQTRIYLKMIIENANREINTISFEKEKKTK